MSNWFWAFVMLFAWHIVDSLERGWLAGVKARREAERLAKKVRVVIVIDDFEHMRLVSTSANVDKDMCEIIVTPIRGK